MTTLALFAALIVAAAGVMAANSYLQQAWAEYTADPNGNEVWSFTGHTYNVTAVAVDDKGYVYSGSFDNTVKKISPDGNELWTFAGGHTTSVYYIDVDANGYSYSVSSETAYKLSLDGDVIWSRASGSSVAVFPGRYGAGFWSL